MATAKKPSINTLLTQVSTLLDQNKELSDKLNGFEERAKTAEAVAGEAEVKIAKAEKEAASEKSTKDYYYKQVQEKDVELEQLHELLDSLECAIPRETQVSEYNKRKNSAMTRLACFLALRK